MKKNNAAAAENPGPQKSRISAPEVIRYSYVNNTTTISATSEHSGMHTTDTNIPVAAMAQ